jgi:hypothetical protein
MTSIERKFFSIYFENYRCRKVLREFKNIEKIIDNLNSIKNTKINNSNLFETEINSNRNIFDKIEKILRDKKVLLSFNDFFKIYNKLFNTEYNFKQILTAWTIFTCPEYILNIKFIDINKLKHDDYKKKLYNVSQQMIYYFTNFSRNNLHKFNKTIYLFDLEFNKFIQLDKIEKIYNYCNDWMEIEETIELIKKSKKYQVDEKKNVIINLINSQNKIKKHIKIFKLDVDYNELKKIVDEKIKFKNLIQKEFKKEIETCFEEGKYNYISEILEEIKQFTIKFNNKNNLDEINELIDIEYIIQLYSNNIITQHEVNNFCLILLDYILPHGSHALEKSKKEEWLNIIQLHEVNNDKISTLSSKFIFFILELINEIMEEIIDFKHFIKFIES